MCDNDHSGRDKGLVPVHLGHFDQEGLQCCYILFRVAPQVCTMRRMVPPLDGDIQMPANVHTVIFLNHAFKQVLDKVAKLSQLQAQGPSTLQKGHILASHVMGYDRHHNLATDRRQQRELLAANCVYCECSLRACQLTVPLFFLKVPPALEHGRAGHQRCRSIDVELVSLPPACVSCMARLRMFPGSVQHIVFLAIAQIPACLQFMNRRVADSQKSQQQQKT